MENHIDIIHKSIDKIEVHDRAFNKIKIRGMVVAGPDIISCTSGQIIKNNDPVSIFEEEFG